MIDLAQKPGDVRDEIKLYGSDNTAANFNQMRSRMGQMISNQQERGLSGVMTNLSKAQGLTTDGQRRVREDIGMGRANMTMMDLKREK